VTGAALAALLEAQGYDFFTGVPCSMISSLIATLETHPRLPYVPARPTVVWDGDGNLLMSLGILPMIGGGPVMGRGRPANLTHVVFDNALYGSTGSQASPSRAVGLHHIARAAGNARAVAVAGADELHGAVAAVVAGGGPSFILARVTGEEQPAPRIPYSPEEIRDRFRSGFGPTMSTRTTR